MPTDNQSPQPTLHAPAVDAAPTAIPSTAPLLTGPKRQHFLPKFYLEGFADKSGMVAVYDRKENQVRVQQPINTGVIGHLYTVEDDQGRKHFELEQMLSEVEGKASLAINKLAAREGISPTERSDMAVFVALAGFRTPDMVDSLKHANSTLVSRMTKQFFGNAKQVKAHLREMPDAVGAD